MANDWIDTFLSATEGIPSPRRFRLWAAISTIASALERRVYTKGRSLFTYPNLFTALTGKSGHGKSLGLMIARDLLAGTSGIMMAPDDVTNASFYDALAGCVRSSMNGTGVTIFSAMTVCSRELGNLLPKYDMGFLSNLSDLYDNPPTFTSARRTSTSVNIDKPTVNILVAATPGFLSDLMPEVAWSQGFTSRMIFIFDHMDNESEVDLFADLPHVSTTALKPDLAEFFKLTGEFEWAKDAQANINAWANAGYPPVPTHGRLKEYCTRRAIHVMKLSMISTISRSGELYVTLQDFERAMDWLLDAETVMPDVFRAMGQRSDAQLIEDLHWHVYTLYSATARDARQPIPASVLWDFLGARIESHRIKGIIELAIMSKKLVKGQYDDEYTPAPLNEHIKV